MPVSLTPPRKFPTDPSHDRVWPTPVATSPNVSVAVLNPHVVWPDTEVRAPPPVRRIENTGHCWVTSGSARRNDVQRLTDRGVQGRAYSPSGGG